ncbi:hypothetical protein F6R83_19125 [Citrobacter amalonaticus]|nr:hypothetical protein [Citrobacter amalonaticus]
MTCRRHTHAPAISLSAQKIVQLSINRRKNQPKNHFNYLFINNYFRKIAISRPLYTFFRQVNTCPHHRFLHNRVKDDESINC